MSNRYRMMSTRIARWSKSRLKSGRTKLLVWWAQGRVVYCRQPYTKGCSCDMMATHTCRQVYIKVNQFCQWGGRRGIAFKECLRDLISGSNLQKHYWTLFYRGLWRALEHYNRRMCSVGIGVVGESRTFLSIESLRSTPLFVRNDGNLMHLKVIGTATASFEMRLAVFPVCNIVRLHVLRRL